MKRYRYGDLVKVAKDLGPSMTHFRSNVYAIVLGDYATRCEYKDEDDFEDDHQVAQSHSYSIFIKDHGSTSWYYHWQLEEVERGRTDLIKKWEMRYKQMWKNCKNLDWIFKNGEMIWEKYNPAKWVLNGEMSKITQTLDNCLNPDDRYSSSKIIFALAERYLLTNDKDGWVKFCSSHKKILRKNKPK